MSGFTAKPGKEKGPTVSIPNTGDFSYEKKTAQLNAFWTGALESASILLWIVTHLPDPKQSPYRRDGGHRHRK